MKRIAIVSINETGLGSAFRLADILYEYDCVVFGKRGVCSDDSGARLFDSLAVELRKIYAQFDAIVSFVATGALIRILAPLLEDKATDPAVLAVSFDLKRVVPLIGGHLSGANRLAAVIEERVPDAISFVTTASDQLGRLSIDLLAAERGWRIEKLSSLARVANMLVDARRVALYCSDAIFRSLSEYDSFSRVERAEDADLIVAVAGDYKEKAVLRPPLSIGIGCMRGSSAESIERAVEEFLRRHDIDRRELKTVASYSAKEDERGLLEFIESYGVEARFFDAAQIEGVEGSFSPSAAGKHFSIKGVAEPSALLASEYGELLFPKEVFYSTITIAGAI